MSQFSEWLAEFGRGALDDELTAALMEVAESVTLQEKPGTVTLKLKLSEKAGGVIVEADVSSSAPRSKPSQFFYVDAMRGELTRRDPKQPQLPGTEDPVKENPTNVE